MTLTAATPAQQTVTLAPLMNPCAHRVAALTEANRQEVLSFLAARPLHTVYMSGLIRDNGIVSPFHRGTFYGCRNSAGMLEGVALIGHATLVEARTDDALATLAEFAQTCPQAFMIIGEQERVGQLWHHYSAGGRAPRLVAREMLFEKSWPAEMHEPVLSLRRAKLSDLDLIVPVHAQMAFEESDINPLEHDAEGFRQRCARRVEQGRVWVVIEQGRLVFKADVISDTPQVVYLEGVYVAPEERGQGMGLRCLSQLCNDLLPRMGSIALLVDERNEAAAQFYRRAGFKLRSFYDTIFLQNGG